MATSLTVTTETGGAFVRLDGREVGYDPVEDMAILPGRHLVQVSKEGWLPQEYLLEARAGTAYSLHFYLEPQEIAASLSVSPGFDELLVDGIAVARSGGAEPVSLSLAPGYRSITARKFGYAEGRLDILAAVDDELDLAMTLEPIGFGISGLTLSRASFDPGNPGWLGSCEVSFSVEGPGSGTLRVEDGEGKALLEIPLGPFASRPQSFVWDGTGPDGRDLQPGSYTIEIEAEGADGFMAGLSAPLAIDSSLAFSPRGGARGTGGSFILPDTRSQAGAALVVEIQAMADLGADASSPSPSLRYGAGLPMGRAFELGLGFEIPLSSGSLAGSARLGAKWSYMDGEPFSAALLVAGLASLPFYGAGPSGEGTGAEILLPFRIGGSGAYASLCPGFRVSALDAAPTLEPLVSLKGGLGYETRFFSVSLSSELRLDPSFSVAYPVRVGLEGRALPLDAPFWLSIVIEGAFSGSASGYACGFGLGLAF